MDPDVTKDFLPMSSLPFEQHRIPTMDKNNIAVQLLSTNAPGIQGIEDAKTAVECAKRINDYTYQLVSKYPNRFAGLAAVPLKRSVS
jgi:2,3-dihydroxybenzoate decarboxylase